MPYNHHLFAMDNPSIPRIAEITVFTPTVPPAHHQLGDDPVTIGRAIECSIPVKDRYLSRKHAELIPVEGGWSLRDCGSANGTWLNGARVDRDVRMRSGDRIRLGDTEIVFHHDHSTDRILAVGEQSISATISIPIREIDYEEPAEPELSEKAIDRLRILNALAAELIEDRPLDELFGYVVDRVMEHLQPSRAAIGLLADGGDSFASVEVRREKQDDASELTISRTLLREIVGEKRALAFVNVAENEKLSQARSIILQGIHSVLCAPLMIGESVVGVLYVDFRFTQKAISAEDVRLVAQIARFAAMKLENTRLREESIQKRLIDEELRTAYAIQKDLLPDAPPQIEGYSFDARNRPCRTVSGDYFDFVVRPDGRVYFVIADVSGKGMTAALIMAGLQASFRIFTKSDPAPAELVSQLNSSLRETIPRSKFVTLFAARLDPERGRIEYANAGHSPPLHLRPDGGQELGETDILLGMMRTATYRNQMLELALGESLVLFTDGITEAENGQGEEFGSSRIAELHARTEASSALEIADAIEESIQSFSDGQPLADDLTLVVIHRERG